MRRAAPAGGGPARMQDARRARRVAPMDVTDSSGSYLTPSFDHARVADAMRPRVLTCDPGTLMVTVAQRMATEHVHAIVVLHEAPRGSALDARHRRHPRLGPRLARTVRCGGPGHQGP